MNKKMKTFQELVQNEGLNEGYIPNLYDQVYPLPFVSSNKKSWTVGVVTKVFPEGMAECWITTDTGLQISEYCCYLYPSLTAGADGVV